MQSARETLNIASSLVARVELLFGRASQTYFHADSVMQLERKMLNLLAGDERMALVVDAVLRELRASGSAAELLDVHPDLAQCRREITRAGASRPHLVQKHFARTDDRNLAAWARLVHAAAGDHAHQFLESAHEVIRGGRATPKPGHESWPARASLTAAIRTRVLADVRAR